MRLSDLCVLAILAAACGDDYDFPTALADTGAFDPAAIAFEPAFPLWSDGATKSRWLVLPEGATIDTSNPDRWTFPVGTKAFKEFTRDGVVVETRMLHKLGAGEWVGVAYAWNADGTEATAAPDGARNALGTGHDIPSTEDCGTCHDGAPDGLLGASAIQLDGALDDVSTHPRTEPLTIPGDATAQAALGYLHGNCGGCHNDDNEFLPLRLWLTVDALDAVESTPTFATAVGIDGDADPVPGIDATQILVPGDPDASLLYRRMAFRGEGAMPPLGSELVDDEALATVGAWIESLAD